MVERFPAIRVSISADQAKGNVGPITAGNGVIVQTAGRGQYLGALTIAYNGGPWRPAATRAEMTVTAEQGEIPDRVDHRSSTYRCDFLQIKQTGRSDPRIRSIIDQAKRRIREQAGK